MTFDKIVQIVAQIKNDPSIEDTASGSSHLINDLGLDSLDIIDFLLELEVAFDLQLDFEKIDFSIMESVSALVTFIDSEKTRQAVAC